MFVIQTRRRKVSFEILVSKSHQRPIRRCEGKFCIIIVSKEAEVENVDRIRLDLNKFQLRALVKLVMNLPVP